MSLFNTLNVGYSGLAASQVGIDTTSHNITNAETEGYTRQRVVTTAATPLSTSTLQIGNGVDVADITRVFDSFVFDSYASLSGDKEYSQYTETVMQELSTYFPEVDQVGIKADLQEYYNMWQTFSDNPDNESIKLALAKQTEKLSQNITDTQNKILDLQSTTNEQIAVDVDEVNLLAKELASINESIELAESGGSYSANDLRDKRNVLEVKLSELIGANSYSTEDSYTLNVNGFNIVDGTSYHPLHIEASGSQGFYEISYERQDGTLIPMNESISGGKIGAALDLRGNKLDTTSGIPTDGALQDIVAHMDAFSVGLIESTNNLYASTATTTMQSNTVDLNPDNTLLNSGLNFNTGSFDLIIYDIDGNETARRTIDIDIGTTMEGVAGSNSIEAQIAAQGDDNSDGNANNDIDDYITTFNWATYANGEGALELAMDPQMESMGYTFAIADNLQTEDYDSGSNFAGALGLNRFFDGDSANTINLHDSLSTNPSNISAGASPIDGDNTVAMSMIQQQYEEYNFDIGNGTEYNTTLYGMFDTIATNVGIETNIAVINNETVSAQYNASVQEYASVSQVSIDEELTNLIKYQTAYGAAAKIITTIDQMMQTLLGIKQ